LYRPGPAARNAEHARDLPDRHLDADTGQEADQDRAGQEIGQESQLYQAGEDQEQGRHEGQNSGICYVLRRARGSQPGQARRHDGRSSRVSADHQVPGGAKQREQGGWDQDGIQAGHYRHPGDLGVAHDFRDGESGERNTCDNIDRYA
jgi:hypothetical protein